MWIKTLKIIVCLQLFILPSVSMAAPLANIQINGYYSFEYEKCIDGDAGCDKNGSFDLDLFDLVMNFNLSDKLRIATDITWEHGTATEDGRGNAAVEYAFAEYSFSNAVKFRAGKMFTHFGIYNEIHTAKPATLTVKEPIATNKNDKLGSDVRFYPRWNTGIAFLGDFDLAGSEADYIVQISNGEDEQNNPFEEDSNSFKALGARIRYQVSENLDIGFSYYHDEENHYDGVGTKDGTTNITSFSGQMEYESDDGLGFELEYVNGKINDYLSTDIKRYAFSLMIFYRMKETITPYYRYEFLDPNTSISNDNGELHILGINLLVDENMYLKFEVDRTQTDSANAKYSGSDFTEFKASISIGF